MHPIQVKSDALGYTHHKYQQYFKGIPVEGAFYTIHKKRGRAVRMSGYFLELDVQKTNPVIGPSEAFAAAKEHAPCRTLPEGLTSNAKLVIYQDYKRKDLPKLAYKVDIHGSNPVYRGDIF